MRAAGREATDWIRSHPAAFARLTGLRGAQFWLGPIDGRPIAIATTLVTLLAAVGAWRVLPAMNGPRRAALLIPLATYPLVYHVVGYEARYRQPLDGLLLLLAAAALVPVASRPRDSRPGLSGPSWPSATRGLSASTARWSSRSRLALECRRPPRRGPASPGRRPTRRGNSARTRRCRQCLALLGRSSTTRREDKLL
jgi:hypothetical protein